MNILPKKRWHVRNQDNKDRVRRDEENARLEEEKERERIATAEKEARIALLRKKNITHDSSANAVVQTTHETGPERHLNLFFVEEAAGSSSFKKDNIDYIKEKNAEKESYEKKIGLLTYVGQSSLEGKEKGELWYTEKKSNKRDKVGSDSSEDEVDPIKKSRLDPMLVVDKHLKQKRDHKKKKKKKKHKKEKEKSSSSKKSIEQLREERLKRENAERHRSEQYLKSLKTSSSSQPEENVSDRNRKYNSQFNPDCSRKR